MDTPEGIKLAYARHMCINWESCYLIQMRKWEVIQVENMKASETSSKWGSRVGVLTEAKFFLIKQKDARRGGSGEASRDSVMSRNWQVSWRRSSTSTPPASPRRRHPRASVTAPAHSPPTRVLWRRNVWFHSSPKTTRLPSGSVQCSKSLTHDAGWEVIYCNNKGCPVTIDCEICLNAIN